MLQMLKVMSIDSDTLGNSETLNVLSYIYQHTEIYKVCSLADCEEIYWEARRCIKEAIRLYTELYIAFVVR